MKARWEALLMRAAARLLDRQVERCKVISRRDNNQLFEMVYEIRAIAKRIEKGYP